MRVKWGQDFTTGLMFILIGIGSLLTIYFYDKLPMGTAQRPGTGVLPVVLSWCLIGTGGILIAKAFAIDQPIPGWSWRPFLAVTVGTVVFGLLVDDAGLVVTMIIAMSICAQGTLETDWREFAIFTLLMIVSSWAMFIWLLGMPISTWPAKVPAIFSAIFR